MAEPESLFGLEETPEQKPPRLGLRNQFIGLLTEPVQTFEKLRVSPSWAWALGTLLVARISLTIVWGLKVDVDAMLRPIMEANSKIPIDRIDSIIEFQKKFLIPFGIMGAFFSVPIMMSLMALIYWLIGKGMAENQKPTYLQSLSLATVPGLALLPQTILIMLMCLIRPVGGLTPEKLSPSSLGFYLHPDNPKLYALLCQIDPFIIFQYILIFLGARHLLKLKLGGAALCAFMAVLFGVAFRVLTAK